MPAPNAAPNASTGTAGFVAAALLVGVAALVAASTGTLAAVGPYLLGVAVLISALSILCVGLR